MTTGFWVRAYEFGPDYVDFETNRGQYVDEEGVLQLPYIEHSEDARPTVIDEEKAAWGPGKSQKEGETTWRFPESPFVDLVDARMIKVY